MTIKYGTFVMCLLLTTFHCTHCTYPGQTELT